MSQSSSAANAILRFFKSVRLAIVLIAILILFSLLSTLVQQGRDAAFYAQEYGSTAAALIRATGLDRFTASLIFIVPMILFIANLLVCTVDRLVSRARRKAVKHFGPDIIHVSLLILAIGALMTTAIRREQDFNMVKGDAVNLPGGYVMTLKSLSYEQYPNGRPKLWTSVVDLDKDGKAVQRDFKIQVNRPLNLGLLKVYQMNYSTGGTVTLRAADGTGGVMQIGQGVKAGDSEMWFEGFQAMGSNPVPIFQEWQGDKMLGRQALPEGSAVGGYTIVATAPQDVTGLRAAVDPGFIPVLGSLILMMVGLTMTSIHKSKGVA